MVLFTFLRCSDVFVSLSAVGPCDASGSATVPDAASPSEFASQLLLSLFLRAVDLTTALVAQRVQQRQQRPAQIRMSSLICRTVSWIEYATSRAKLSSTLHLEPEH